MHSEIDKAISKKKKEFDPGKEFKIEHVSDKIRFAKKIKDEPPVKDFLGIEAKEVEIVTTDKDGDETKRKGVMVLDTNNKVTVHDGIFNIDLNVDAYWWFVRACNIFPWLLDQGIRTHLDIKHSHAPEKRKIEFPYILVGLAVTGLILIFFLFKFIFMK